MTLTTKTGTSGTTAVYHGKAKVGYIAGDNGRYHWEVILVSEQMQGHPRGVRNTREEALAMIQRYFELWCTAAGLKS